MSTVKRRVVYVSDEEWAGVRAQAHSGDVTASAVVRSLIAGVDAVKRATPAATPRPKRRTLWFTDTEWAALQTVAAASDTNVSRLIRWLVLTAAGGVGPTDRVTETETAVHRRLESEFANVPPPTVLGHAYSSRPFTPVPKSGRGGSV